MSGKLFPIAVPPNAWWIHELVRPLLERAVILDRGKSTVDDVLDKIRKEEDVLWVVCNVHHDILACVVTSLDVYPTKKKVCTVRWAAGKHVHQWKDLMHFLIEYAENEQCQSIEIHGRPGWGRLFPQFIELYRVFEKEL